MHFSQAQLRNTIGISVETFRHWQRVLPPFALPKRHATKYSLGDMLAAAILHRLTDRCGIRVGALRTISEALFAICSSHSWPALERKSLIISVPDGICRLDSIEATAPLGDFVVVCQISPVIGALRKALARQQTSAATKRSFAFPPAAFAARRAARPGA